MPIDYSQGCLTRDEVIAGGGMVIENNDGTVSVFMPDANGAQYPQQLTKSCCEALLTQLGANDLPEPVYSFDIDQQKCLWGAGCNGNIKPFKVVLNPEGNDGALFLINEGSNEHCDLNVSFDYLFQINCDDIVDRLTEAANSSGFDAQIWTQITGLMTVNETYSQQLAGYETQIFLLQEQLENTPFVIQCNETEISGPIIDPKTPPVRPTRPNANLDIGFGTTPVRILPIPQYGIKTYCLTASGLDAWNAILGTNDYNTWLNSNGTNTSVYNCDDVNALVAQDNQTGNLLGTCDVSITERQEIITQINALYDAIHKLEGDITLVENQITTLSGATEPCSTVSQILESLNVSMTVEVVNESTNMLETVYNQSLINIGSGNIATYLVDNNPMTGFLASGSTSGSTACETMFRNLMQELVPLLPNSGTTEIQDLVQTSFDSQWLHFDTTITDQNILDQIYNKKIKISFMVNDCCVDFGILVDRVNINKECTSIDNVSFTISKNPSFDMIRVLDNKKSWLSNEDYEHRQFDLKYRYTEYDINDYRLAINSKEVDLDISPSNAIEQDFYCYVMDNPCILECPTGTTTVSINTKTDYNFAEILSAQTLSCESGATTACTVDSLWSLEITIGCDTIYSGTPFYTGTTITDAPTENDYILALSGAATELGLDFSASGGTGTFSYSFDCEGNDYNNKCFKVDLSLDITTNCGISKEFQDNTNFQFQDGTDYEFN